MTNTQLPYVQQVRYTPPERYAALDGLRGVAAVIVLLWHSFLIISPYLLTDPGIGTTIHNLLLDTPLRLLLAGPEAVSVFFVLSGFVITIPVLKRGRKFSWLAYYPQRILRLYIPVAAAFFFALGLVLWIPRHPPAIQQGQWLVRTNWETVDWDRFWQMFTIFGSQGFTINNPTWSLYWEILFSLLLPVFVYIGLLIKRIWYVGFIGLLAAETYGYWYSDPAFTYLPLFGFGVLLAMHRQRLSEIMANMFASTNQWLIGLPWFALSTFCLIGYNLFPPEQKILAHWLHSLSPIGAISFVLMAMGLPFFKTLLRTNLAQALGRISFSLYLVHVPIIVTYAYLLGDQWFTGYLVGLLTSLVIAIIFYLLIERPSHFIARGVGTLVSLIPRLNFQQLRRSYARQEQRQGKRVRRQEPHYTDAP